MKTLNNDIRVHRSESWIFDRKIVNKDNSPYIISNKLNNPYFLFTVSTTRYQQDSRYLYRKWIDLSSMPRFEQTQVVNINNCKTTTGDTITGFSSITKLTSYTDTSSVVHDNIICIQTIGTNTVAYQPGDCVFTDGTNYKYWDPTKTEDGWLDYECKISVIFPTSITKNWIEQTYYYSINLVSGNTTLSYLKGLCDENNISYSENSTVADLVDLLTEANVEIPINYKAPLSSIELSLPIVVPTQMQVNSNLNGGDL